jgi:tRNA dimethylallyltransferase
VIQFLDGECTEPEMIELIKRNSRRYAKRQLTWFRADERIMWIDVEKGGDLEQAVNQIASVTKLSPIPARAR